MEAVIYRTVMEDISIEVTEHDARRGFVEFECRACQGTGVFAANEEYEQPCVECSTTGAKEATLL